MKTLRVLKGPTQEFLTITEFAERIGVSRAWVSTMKKRGLLPENCIRHIGSRNYRIDWLEYCRIKEEQKNNLGKPGNRNNTHRNCSTKLKVVQGQI